MKRSSLIVLTLALSVLGFGLAQRQFLTIGTGGVTGVYYPVGGATARLVNEADVGLRLTVESTAGSVFNVRAMAAGELDLALAQSDVVYQAYNGEAEFEGEPVERLRTVMGLHAEPLHLICRQEAGVESLEDIVGTSINLGPPGSGILNTVQAVLEVYGIDEGELQAEYLRPAEAPDFLRDGRLDCFFYTVGIGGAAIQDIAVTTDITLVPLDGPELEGLIEEFPYYAFATVPAGTYSGIDEDVTIFGVKALFATTTDLDDEVVYNVVTAVLNNLETFQQTHPALAGLTEEDFLSGLGAPLHPGAERAYREAGMID
ncbi:MAG: TAXI family TRAP transporter solute-binding subunit [Deinococcota bacterium]|jgi:TRAP transporter TAXI family solute receptor|nr:TAXI family TRAP transporter solute-binding subunit [Deinococcota bacterium]